jgi:aryl-alcohol dehydrogenase-like predicted oxidoreductase
MNYRPLGRTGWRVSGVSFGAWAIGGSWGHVSETDALAALNNALDSGVNFIDTADVYVMVEASAWSPASGRIVRKRL